MITTFVSDSICARENDKKSKRDTKKNISNFQFYWQTSEYSLIFIFLRKRSKSVFSCLHSVNFFFFIFFVSSTPPTLSHTAPNRTHTYVIYNTSEKLGTKTNYESTLNKNHTHIQTIYIENRQQEILRVWQKQRIIYEWHWFIALAIPYCCRFVNPFSNRTKFTLVLGFLGVIFTTANLKEWIKRLRFWFHYQIEIEWQILWNLHQYWLHYESSERHTTKSHPKILKFTTRTRFVWPATRVYLFRQKSLTIIWHSTKKFLLCSSANPPSCHLYSCCYRCRCWLPVTFLLFNLFFITVFRHSPM